ncbi:hypothetical protein J6590_034770 [Homalodisca vitripennis]|nr:hypothetical protein J6590_034770 [Homalodisca vitripennis]
MSMYHNNCKRLQHALSKEIEVRSGRQCERPGTARLGTARRGTGTGCDATVTATARQDRLDGRADRAPHWSAVAPTYIDHLRAIRIGILRSDPTYWPDPFILATTPNCQYPIQDSPLPSAASLYLCLSTPSDTRRQLFSF